MAEAILLGPVLRLTLYALVPLLIRFGYAGFGCLKAGKKLVIAFTWAAIATFLAIMISTGGNVISGAELIGEILGGTTVGGLIGELIMTVNSKKSETENAVTPTNNAMNSDETISARAEPETTSKKEVTDIEESEPATVVADMVEDIKSQFTPNEGETIADVAMQTEETRELEKDAIEGSVNKEQIEKTSIHGDTDSMFVVPDEELRLLKRLHDSGVLSDSEFKEKKKMLLKI